jgi:hypothetical protein
MRRALTALALMLGLPLSVAACLWDRDTPANEARGMPEVVAVLTGRFERNPPLFYEMRLARVTAHLKDHPEDLAAYDDAGVACDRLGLGDAAVSWMGKKRAQLERLEASRPDGQEQRYRYHANLGTFLVHRWVRQGADRTKIDQVKAARDEIARALKINPNAHFGREKYQLRALEWIVEPPKAEGSHYLPNLLDVNFDSTIPQMDPEEADDAVRGLAGLIVLGNAWESVDVFHALNIALQRDSIGYGKGPEGGRNTLAYLAWLRCLELVNAGKGSMLPDAPKGEDLKALLPPLKFVQAKAALDTAFPKLRAEADAWHLARTAFMTGRLKEGRHPDTDPSFWDGYKERPAPGLPTVSDPQAYKAWLMNLILVIGVTLAIGLLVVRRAKSRRRIDVGLPSSEAIKPEKIPAASN